MMKLAINTRGYTLIEILIVMVIISIVGSMALLTISHNQSSRLKYFSKQLSNIMTLAEEQAMLRPAILGVVFTPDSFQFFQFQDTLKKDEEHWKPLTDKNLGEHPFPSGAHLLLQVQGKMIEPAENFNHPEPHIIFSTNGDVTPFDIFIGKKDASPLYTVTGNASGAIQNGEFNEK